MLSTHADKQGVDISFTVLCFLFVCTVTDLYTEDKPSGVKFCMVAHRLPGQVISHLENFAPPEASLEAQNGVYMYVQFVWGLNHTRGLCT